MKTKKALRASPRKKAEALSKVFRAGNSLANIAFNLKQNDTLPPDLRAMLETFQVNWDKAWRDYTELLPARKAAKPSKSKKSRGRVAGGTDK
jgi:hypothetical protein